MGKFSLNVVENWNPVSYSKEQIDDAFITKKEIGNVTEALENIIAIQNKLIGGESV